MQARLRIGILAALAPLLGACDAHKPTGPFMSPAPPVIRVINATTRVIPDTGGRSALEVSAWLLNLNAIFIQVSTGSRCPLHIQLSPVESYAGGFDPSLVCPPTASTLNVAPGDSMFVVGVLHADSLATFPPGRYGIEIQLTTSTGWLGEPAGLIQLPLGGS